MEETREDTKDKDFRREVRNFVIVLLLCAFGIFMAVRGVRFTDRAPEVPELRRVEPNAEEMRRVCGPPSPGDRPVVISMVFGVEKRPWIEDAVERFSRICTNIQVELVGMDSIEAADAILAGTLSPTLWAPADDLVLEYLDYKWKKKRPNEVLFDASTKVSLVRSPLVVLVWEDRSRVLEAAMRLDPREEGPWAKALCAGIPRDPDITRMVTQDMLPARWSEWYRPAAPAAPAAKKLARGAKKLDPDPDPDPAPVYEAPFPKLAEIARWGRVKFGHVSPTRSASGLEALYLMAYDYVLPERERLEQGGGAPPANPPQAPGEEKLTEGSDRQKSKFERALADQRDSLQRWLRRCEAGLEPPMRSTRALTDTMFDVGPTEYDGVVTYEHLTFFVLDRMDENENVMRTMRVIYPRPTIMNRHPVVVFRPTSEGLKAEHEAARRWIDFLRTKEMQEKAIEYGFRPAIPEVSIRAYTADTNPFLKYRRYGVAFENPLLEPPRIDGETISGLIEVWRDATGRN